MDPFFIFSLGVDASDQEVQQRYYQLIEKFPPDRHPEEFTMIREAYEQLKDQQRRMKTRLFYFTDPDKGVPLLQTLPEPTSAKRRRLATNELAELLKKKRAL